jgi:enterochelin esterase-like enzyme
MDRSRLLSIIAVVSLVPPFAGCGAKKEARISAPPQTAAPIATTPDEEIDSPRIVALNRAIAAGDRIALDQFWREMKAKAPLIEPVVGDDSHVWVTFVWRGDTKTRRVGLAGGLPAHAPIKQMARLADTDLWYRTERIPKDARFTYYFTVNEPIKPPTDMEGLRESLRQFPPLRDPLNARSFQGRSVVELPEAPPQPWLERLRGVPRGELSRASVPSASLKETRPIAVYTPAEYQSDGEPYGLLIVLDGEPYGSKQPVLIPTPTILDNLIAKGKIPPIVAVLVDNVAKRNRDLLCSAPFADFLANELVPWVRKLVHVSPDPSRVVVCGSSAGGLCAAYCGLRHPDAFGNILSQSGAFDYYPGLYVTVLPDDSTETGWLIRQFATTPKLPLRFYLEVGRFERNWTDLVAENRRMRDVLEAKGYFVTYSEYDGGHDYICWRGSLADGLIALIGTQTRR